METSHGTLWRPCFRSRSLSGGKTRSHRRVSSRRMAILELRFRKHFKVMIVRFVAISGALIMCQAYLNTFLDTTHFSLTRVLPRATWRQQQRGRVRMQTQPGRRQRPCSRPLSCRHLQAGVSQLGMLLLIAYLSLVAVQF